MATKTLEEGIAKEIVEGHDFFKTNYPKLTDAVKALETISAETKAAVKGFEGIDIKATLAEIEKMKANFDSMKKQIAASKSGLYIPGLEDYADKFSVLRAACAIRMKNWKDAGFEKEVMDQAQSKASAVAGIDSQGGWFVPDQVIPEVIAAIYARSVLIDLAGDGKTRISVLDGLVGNPARIPKFIGGMVAYWIGEEDNYAETASKVGMVSMTPKKMGLLTRITDEMRRFQGFGFETLMRNDMSRAAAKKLDYTAMYGKGTDNEPRGLSKIKDIQVFSAETGTVVPWTAPFANPAGVTGIGGQLNFDGLMEMQGAIEDANLTVEDDWAWISAPRYFRRIQQLKVSFYSGQTANQAYLLGVPMLTADRLKALIGDYDKSTQIPTSNKAGASLGWVPSGAGLAGNFGDVFGSNWNEFLFGRWSGIEIVDDGGTGSGFIKDETLIKFRMYGDFGHRHEKAIVICPDAQMRG